MQRCDWTEGQTQQGVPVWVIQDFSFFLSGVVWMFSQMKSLRPTAKSRQENLCLSSYEKQRCGRQSRVSMFGKEVTRILIQFRKEKFQFWGYCGKKWERRKKCRGRFERAPIMLFGLFNTLALGMFIFNIMSQCRVITSTHLTLTPRIHSELSNTFSSKLHVFFLFLTSQ